MLRRSTLIIPFILLVVVITVLAFTFTHRIRNHGIIKTIGCVIDTTEIDWGFIAVGETKSKVINIGNNGTVPITLSFNVSDWNPVEASNYLWVSWNYSDVVINPNDFIPVELYLHVFQNTTGITDFEFIITIIASEVS